ncbi:anhydro-N-acetylmuramic acid kinase [Psychroserpens sp. XS_ASV72]|uniref:anhydro-N-acetylmuramic acid kinase n=1 Tax=Psychroserpens sp. XS_ASV72 TaxID=3241293 RepID=UPI003510FD0D
MEYNVIGVMSGTSLDGIDLAYINFRIDKIWSFKLLSCTTVPYSESWKKTLTDLIELDESELKKIDDRYTEYLGKTINSFIAQNKLHAIDAVCSHGHTAIHKPKEGITYQIGNQDSLSQLVQNVIVCDFRIQDVKFGGQGAPLVPVGDELLFKNYGFCINLGGFANVSYKEKGKRLAYDICPVNIVLNTYCRTIGFDFDDQGKIASSGTVNLKLLQKLNDLDYYKTPFPKSLGLEWVTKYVFPIINSFQIGVEDILRTYIEHISMQISAVLKNNPQSSVLITGGGAYNSFLIQRIQKMNANEIIVPDSYLIEFKEALIFGLLGVLKLRGEVNCLASVTGAKNDHCSGVIHYP